MNIFCLFAFSLLFSFVYFQHEQLNPGLHKLQAIGPLYSVSKWVGFVKGDYVICLEREMEFQVEITN